MTIDRAHEDNMNRHIVFVTDYGFPDHFKGSRAHRYHELFVEGREKIKISDISVFLNEHSEYEFKKCIKGGDKSNYFTFVYANFLNKKDKIKIHLFRDFSITCLVSKELLDRIAMEDSKFVSTNVGSQNRPMKKKKENSIGCVLFIYYRFFEKHIDCHLQFITSCFLFKS